MVKTQSPVNDQSSKLSASTAAELPNKESGEAQTDNMSSILSVGTEEMEQAIGLDSSCSTEGQTVSRMLNQKGQSDLLINS